MNHRYLSKLTVLVSLCITIGFSFVCTNGQAQDIISGNVMDPNDEPVIYAHVFLKNNQKKGAVTNELGHFYLSLGQDFIADTIVVSILGFETFYLPINETDAKDIRIKLIPNAFLLDEITIVSDSYLRHVMKEAVNHIENNYSSSTHEMKAYYQEYTISDDKYSEFIEADVQFRLNGYQAKLNFEKCYLNQLRKTDDTRNLPDRLKGGVNAIYFTNDKNPIIKKSFSHYKLNQQSNDINKLLAGLDAIKNLELLD